MTNDGSNYSKISKVNEQGFSPFVFSGEDLMFFNLISLPKRSDIRRFKTGDGRNKNKRGIT
jgi:hypothetical protein